MEINLGHIIQSLLAAGLLGLGTAATRALIALSGEVREIRVQVQIAMKNMEDHEHRLRHLENGDPRSSHRQ